MTTVAELLIDSLADHGVTQVWGVVGDALNPVTDAIRREDRIEWVGVRHEEVGAFAASAQAQLTDRLAVCMGTVGPGAIHLLNGLYDAKKSHAPVLAICGQVPREEMGSDFFQEVDNDALFADVAVFNRTVTSVDQLPGLIEQAGNAALQQRGVAVLTLPGDVGGLDLPKHTPVPRFVADLPGATPSPEPLRAAAAALNAAGSVTLLVGQGARHARPEVLELAERLNAPMVLTLKAKEGLEEDNPFEVGQSGLIGNPATKVAFDGCDVLLLVGTDFPYKDFLPEREGRGPARRARHAHRAAYAGRPPARRRRAPGAAGAAAAARAQGGPTGSWTKARTTYDDVARAAAALRRPGLRPQAGRACCAARSTTPTRGSGPSCWPRWSTGTPPTTRSSPPTPACRRSGCPASSG